MLNQLKNKMNIHKGDGIPIIGCIIYSVRIEFFLSMNFGRSPLRKMVRKYRGIWNTIFTIITLSFSITGFVLKYAYGFSGFPGPFIVAIVIGGITNLLAVVPYQLFALGLKRVEALPEAKQHQLLQEAELKRLEMLGRTPKKNQDQPQEEK